MCGKCENYITEKMSYSEKGSAHFREIFLHKGGWRGVKKIENDLEHEKH